MNSVILYKLQDQGGGGWRHYYGNGQAPNSQIKKLLFQICSEVIY